jgi:hypothetical protein
MRLARSTTSRKYAVRFSWSNCFDRLGEDLDRDNNRVRRRRRSCKYSWPRPRRRQQGRSIGRGRETGTTVGHPSRMRVCDVLSRCLAAFSRRILVFQIGAKLASGRALQSAGARDGASQSMGCAGRSFDRGRLPRGNQSRRLYGDHDCRYRSATVRLPSQ